MRYKQEQLDDCRAILADCQEATERKEPEARNAIAAFEEALLNLPTGVDELNESLA